MSEGNIDVKCYSTTTVHSRVKLEDPYKDHDMHDLFSNSNYLTALQAITILTILGKSCFVV